MVLEDVLGTAERTLLARGDDGSVIDLRKELLEAMRPDLVAAVEGLTGRHVTALMGDTNPIPNIASHVVVLDQPIHAQPAGATGDAGLRRRPPQRS